LGSIVEGAQEKKCKALQSFSTTAKGNLSENICTVGQYQSSIYMLHNGVYLSNL